MQLSLIPGPLQRGAAEESGVGAELQHAVAEDHDVGTRRRIACFLAHHSRYSLRATMSSAGTANESTAARLAAPGPASVGVGFQNWK